jgi:molecular chaperone DnaK (HSP70)
MRLCAKCSSWWIAEGDEFCGNCGHGLFDFAFEIESPEYWLGTGKSVTVTARLENTGSNKLSIDTVEVIAPDFEVEFDPETPFDLKVPPETESARDFSIVLKAPEHAEGALEPASTVTLRAVSGTRERTASFQTLITPQIERDKEKMFVDTSSGRGRLDFRVVQGKPEVLAIDCDSKLFAFEKGDAVCTEDGLTIPCVIDERVKDERPNSISLVLTLRGLEPKRYEVELDYPRKAISFEGFRRGLSSEIRSNTLFKRKIRIRCSGNIPTKIVGYDISPDLGIDIDGLVDGTVIKPNEGMQFDIRFDPEAYLSRTETKLERELLIDATLTLRIDCEDAPTVDYPITLTIVPPKVLSDYAGFDFGTSYSCISIGDDDLAVLGKQEPEGASHSDTEVDMSRKRVVPSLVHVGRSKGSEELTYKFGEEAESLIRVQPWQVIRTVKRLLGHKRAGAMGQGPYHINVLVDGRRKRFRPVEITTRLLQDLIDRVEKNHDLRIERAVVTVPSRFSQNQVHALEEAFERTTLKELEYIDESLAAGMDVIKKKMQDRDTLKFMIFDFGGGTIDITVLSAERTVLVDGEAVGADDLGPAVGADQIDITVDVKGVWGYRGFGGTNVTERLQDYLHKRIVDIIERGEGEGEFRGIKHVPYGNLPANGIWDNDLVMENYYTLSEMAEVAKCQLSTEEDYRTARPLHCETDDGELVMRTLDITVKRDELEGLIKDDLNRIALEMKRLLEVIDMDESELDFIELAGQSSRIPIVQSILEEHFGAERVELVPDLKECVAKGAYWYGKMISQVMAGIRIRLREDCHNRTASRFGIEALDHNGESYFEPIIEFGRPIPAKGLLDSGRVRIEPSRRIKVTVYENLSLDDSRISGNDDCEEIGHFWKDISEVDFNPRDKRQHIEMELNTDKLLRVYLQLGEHREEFTFQAADGF